MSFGIYIEDQSNEISSLFATENNEKNVKLHDWQNRAIKYFFEHDGKVIYEVATGAGKTFLAITILKEIHKLEPNLKCLIINPKNVILDVWFRELYTAGYSLPDVGVYYGFAKEYGKKITITNMQNLSRIAFEIFDIIIWDEIHWAGATTNIKYIESTKAKYLIGLSATTERVDGKHWEVLKKFNYNKFVYSPQQALQEGILNSFIFYNIGVEMDDETYEEYTDLTKQINQILLAGGGFNRIMKSKGGMKYTMLSLMTKRKQIVNNYYRKFDVAKFICQKYKDEKTLIFNQYNSQTSKLYWSLLDVGIKGRILHSGVKQTEREQILSDFRKDKFNTLLATKILDEGVNIPAISCAIILASDSSDKQTIQRLGRVLRRKKNQSLLFQVYCKGTIEQDNAVNRTNLFKELSTEYKDYEYGKEDKELVLD